MVTVGLLVRATTIADEAGDQFAKEQGLSFAKVHRWRLFYTRKHVQQGFGHHGEKQKLLD